MVQRYLLLWCLCVLACATALAGDIPHARDLLLVENRGQIVDANGTTRPDLLFTAATEGLNLYCTRTGISYVFSRVSGSHADTALFRTPDDEPFRLLPFDSATVTTYRMDVEFVGASPGVEIIPQEPAPERFHYYYAHCPDGITDVRGYRRVLYRNLYPSIDLVLYAKGRSLKYDIIVHPGGDPASVRLRYTGADSITGGEDGSLQMATPLGTVVEERPYTYQGEREIGSRFVVEGSDVLFEVDAYDPQAPLVIDPTITWSTYYGGTMNELSATVAVDRSRNIVVGGTTGSTDFPVLNAIQTGNAGSSDGVVMKFAPDGRRLWATYYGGSSLEYGVSVAVDSAGGIVLGGHTSSADFPVENASQPAFAGGNDAFVLKLSSAGQRIWATYLGGMSTDLTTCIAMDNTGYIVTTGETVSQDFPVLNAYDATLAGGNDRFIARFSDQGLLLWSTYFGGSGAESMGNQVAVNNLAVDVSNNVIVVGATTSFDFPVSTNAMQTVNNGNEDCFIAKFNPVGELLWSTYYGGGNNDRAHGVATDGLEGIIITGLTFSSDLPSTFGYSGGGDAFVLKVHPRGQRIWSMYYGGRGLDWFNGADVDPDSRIVLFGSTESTDFPLEQPFQRSKLGTSDGALLMMNRDGQRIWATYLGGSGYENGYDIDLDNAGGIVVVGTTTSSDYPVVNPFQSSNSGIHDMFITKLGCEIAEPEIAPVGFVQICEGETLTIGVPDEYDSYIWNTGATTASITVDKSGRYFVVVANGEGCTSASQMVTLEVLPTPKPEIDGGSVVCGTTPAVLQTATGYAAYSWRSDGTTATLSTTATLEVREAGLYSVTVTSANGCVGTSATFLVRQLPLPQTGIVLSTGSGTICPGDSVVLTATGAHAGYLWNTGATTAGIVVRHAGQYTVTVTDDNGCRSLPVSQTISIVQLPSDGIRGPVVACLNSEMEYRGSTTADVAYSWSVTGGIALTDATAGTVRVRWTTTGTASVVLARTVQGCTAVTTLTVSVADSLQPRIVGPAVLCPGETVVLGVEGGYTRYEWSTGVTTPTLTIDEPGVYLVRVVGDGCAGTSLPFVVTSASAPSATLLIDGLQELCPGDSTVLRVVGAAEQYVWNDGSTSPTLTVYEPGSYSVAVVNAEGCSTTAGITVPAASLQPVVEGPASLCRDAVADYTATATGTSLVYAWSVTGGVVLSGQSTATVRVQWQSGTSGTLMLVVRRKGTACTAETTLDVAIGEQLHPSVTASSLVLCPGGTVELRASAGYASYLWMPGGATTSTIVVHEPGVYRLHVRDAAGCEGDAEVEVRAGGQPVVAVSAPTLVLCEGGTTTLAATEGFRSYLWSTGETTASIVVQHQGEYTVTVTNADGCTGSTSVVVRGRTVDLGSDGVVSWSGVAVGDAVTDVQVWTNTGDEAVRVESAVFVDGVPGFEVETVPALPADIPPGGTLSLTLRFRPSQAGSYVDTLLVAIEQPCTAVRRIDVAATAVVVTTALVARLPDTTGYPWQRGYRIPLYARLLSDDLYDGGTVEFEVAMDASVVFPTALTRGEITGNAVDAATGERVITGRVEGVAVSGAETVVTEFVSDLLLGERDGTALVLRRFEWLEAPAMSVTEEDGFLHLEGICREGEARFIRSRDGFGITVQPHPVSDRLTALVEVVEAGECVLELYSADGRCERLGQWEHRAGEDGAVIVSYDVTARSAGVYWLVLRTPTQTESTMLLIVK